MLAHRAPRLERHGSSAARALLRRLGDGHYRRYQRQPPPVVAHHQALEDDDVG